MSHCVHKIINSSKVISFREGLNILKILSVDEETHLIDEETNFDYCCNITYLNGKTFYLIKLYN